MQTHTHLYYKYVGIEGDRYDGDDGDDDDDRELVESGSKITFSRNMQN